MASSSNLLTTDCRWKCR